MQLIPELEVFVTTPKPEYERPEITYYGELTELTEGTVTGNTFDSNHFTGQHFIPNILSCVPGHGTCVTLP